MFPIRLSRRVGGQVKSTDSISVFCICRLPKYTNSSWVQCSQCKEWYHDGVCDDVPKDLLNSKKPWLCSMCI